MFYRMVNGNQAQADTLVDGALKRKADKVYDVLIEELWLVNEVVGIFYVVLIPSVPCESHHTFK